MVVSSGRTGDYEKIIDAVCSPPSRHARRHLESLAEPESRTPKSGDESAARGFGSASELRPGNYGDCAWFGGRKERGGVNRTEVLAFAFLSSANELMSSTARPSPQNRFAVIFDIFQEDKLLFFQEIVLLAVKLWIL